MRRNVSVKEHSASSSGVLGKLAYFAAVGLTIGFLGFVAGAYNMYTDAFPSRYLADAYRGGLALFEQRTQFSNPYPRELWQPARTEQRGVTIHDVERAYEGLTLYTSGHAQKAFLISMTGEVVHEWSVPFSALWDESAAVRNPRPDRNLYYRKAHLYPNGDLLAIYIGIGDTPWGYGLVKINKDSEVQWKFLEQVHHDVTVAEDGTIFTLTHEVTNHEIERFGHLKPPRIDDFVVLLSPKAR